MPATDQQIADAARESLARILATDTANWSEGERKQQQLEIGQLRATIREFEAMAARSTRQIFSPIKRVNL